MIAYHDQEWGVPVHDDRHFFEMLTLEGAQAGLSWSTILSRREGYKRAFANFEAPQVAAFTDEKVAQLLLDAGIIRNRAKVLSTIQNAKMLMAVQEEFGSFDSYIWRFVDGRPLRNSWTEMSQVPASTEVSDAMSKDLKKRGFSFVGTTICYAFMQATGLVNDHLVTCVRYAQVQGLNRP